MATWRIGDDPKGQVPEDSDNRNPVRESWKHMRGTTLEEYSAYLKSLTTPHEVLDAGPGIDDLDEPLWRDQDTGRDIEL